MELAKIEINDFGGAPICEHNMPCAICGTRHAVYFLNEGLFLPCRECEAKGWRLIRYRGWFKRFIDWVYS